MTINELKRSGEYKKLGISSIGKLLDLIFDTNTTINERILLTLWTIFLCLDIYCIGSTYYLYLNKKNPITYIIIMLFSLFHFFITVFFYVSKVTFLQIKSIFSFASYRVKWIYNTIDTDLYLYEITEKRRSHGKAS